jgi:hypothetical protein
METRSRHSNPAFQCHFDITRSTGSRIKREIFPKEAIREWGSTSGKLDCVTSANGSATD